MSMHESATENENRTGPASAATRSGAGGATVLPDWHGWTALTPLPDSPEPVRPQGDVQRHGGRTAFRDTTHKGGPFDGLAELLAPAGGPDAAFAAFHFGADAIYLGLMKFSARAEAENFTLAEVDEDHRLCSQPPAAPPRLRDYQHTDPSG